MSGSPVVPIVELVGAGMSAIVAAIPITEASTGSPVSVVGGLAVLCRLSQPYRVTTDLDTVNRRRVGQPSQLELLVTRGARRSGPSGVLLDTPLGPVQVDVLEVNDADLSDLPADPSDRLHVLSHAWAAETASPVVLRSERGAEVHTLAARPGALIAMKLQSSMNRGAAREATDVLDIVRLTLDPGCGEASRTELASAGDQLRQDALRHAHLWFNERADRTLRVVRKIPEGRDTTGDDLQLVGELLISALNVPV